MTTPTKKAKPMKKKSFASNASQVVRHGWVKLIVLCGLDPWA